MKIYTMFIFYSFDINLFNSSVYTFMCICICGLCLYDYVAYDLKILCLLLLMIILNNVMVHNKSTMCLLQPLFYNVLNESEKGIIYWSSVNVMCFQRHLFLPGTCTVNIYIPWKPLPIAFITFFSELSVLHENL